MVRVRLERRLPAARTGGGGLGRDAHAGDGGAGAGDCAIREALLEAGAREVPAVAHDDSALLAVHDPALVEFLRTAWDEWAAAGLPSDRVVPYVFARSELTSGRVPATPTAVWARPGLFAYDTMTLIGPGTWEAARAAVDVALTAVDLVTDGERVAYACCRPPGHHVTRSLYGGSCYLNNTAVAAAELLTRLGGPVAVVDIDAHHGNGTQELFLDRGDVLTASVHVDPGAGWFPHFLGFAAESDAANLNLPLAPGTGDDGWLAAVREAAEFAAPRPRTRRRTRRRRRRRRSREPARGERRGLPRGGPDPRRARAADGRRPGGRLRPRHDRIAGRRRPWPV